MVSRPAYIVFYQEDAGILELHRQMLGDRAMNHVVYTHYTAEVLAEVIANPVDLVVAGEAYYRDSAKARLRLALALEKARSSGNKYVGLPGDRIRGCTHLSQLIYNVDPRVLVIRYSGFGPLPPRGGYPPPSEDRLEWPDRVVGEVPKPSPADGILGLFDSPSLAEIIRDRDWMRLRRTHPRVHFYATLERDHGFRV